MRINSGMVLLRGYEERLTPIFIITLFRNFNIYIKYISGTAQPQMPIKNIKKIIIPVPPLELQNQFAQKVEAIESQKSLLEESLSQMEDNYNNLMQMAFKGELF